ncbi:MAG: chemotaxis protein CheW [Tuberibacillus sp.]
MDHESSTAQDIIIFSAGREQFALSIHDIVEIVNPVQVKIVPLAPPSIEGVIHARDTIYPVFNLITFFETEKIAVNREEERIILVKWQDTSLAIHVDRIETLTSYQKSDLINDFQSENKRINEFLKGTLQNSVFLLDLGRIIESLKQEAEHLASV